MRATGKCVVGSRASSAEIIMLAAVCFYVLQFCRDVDGDTATWVPTFCSLDT